MLLSGLGGGIVLIGVEDDGSIGGITRDKLEEWVMTTCRDKIRPGLIPFYEVIKNIEPGKDIAIIKVPRGLSVHTLWHNNKNSYFIRVGSTSREPTPEELGRLFQQRGNIRAELSCVSGTKFSDLDLRRLKDYFIRIRQQPEAVPADDDEAGWKMLLVNTEFMNDDGINVAGLLLFGGNPQRFLPHTSISATAYPGNDKDYAARERLRLQGPITGLFTIGSNGKLQAVETGIVEQASDFVFRNTGITAKIIDGARREDKPSYPAEVIREIIVNAIIHRDYLLLGTDIELSIYSDRIEVVSPGRLYNGITINRMRVGCRASRNQLIRDTMSDYKYMDNSGLGISRKVIPLMKIHNNTDPVLIEDNEQFIVKLLAGSQQS